MNIDAAAKDRYLENVTCGGPSRELLSLQLQASRLAPSTAATTCHSASASAASASAASASTATASTATASTATASRRLVAAELAQDCLGRGDGGLLGGTAGINGIYAALLAPCKAIGQAPDLSGVCRRPDRILDAPGLQDDFYLNTLDFSARNVLGVGLGASVYLWNGVDGTVKELLSLPEDGNGTSAYVASVHWIHDGRSIALGLSNGSVQIWDVERSRKLRTMLVSPGHRVAALASHRHILSSGSRNGLTANHDVRAARHLLATLNDGSLGRGEVCGLRWSPDGDQLAAGTNDNCVHLWGGSGGTVPGSHRLLEGHGSAVKALAWCPWRRGVLATGGGSQDRTIRLWDVAQDEPLAIVNTASAVSGLLWSGTGSRELVSTHGLERNHIALWQTDETTQSMALRAEIEGAHEGRILHCCAAPNGRAIATASSDESIKFWSIFSKPSEQARGKKSAAPLASLNGSQTASLSSPFSLKNRLFR